MLIVEKLSSASKMLQINLMSNSALAFKDIDEYIDSKILEALMNPQETILDKTITEKMETVDMSELDMLKAKLGILNQGEDEYFPGIKNFEDAPEVEQFGKKL